MLSTNNTEHKFGIKYSYIAIAMNDTLKLINNKIKNIEINKTVGIAIDDNWLCAVQMVFYALICSGFCFALLWTSGLIVFAGIARIGATASVAYSWLDNLDL